MIRSRTLPFAAPSAVILAALSACGGSDGAPTEGAADFVVTVDTAAPTSLGTTTQIPVTLRSTGYAGVVGLAVSGAPASWEVATSDTSVALAANDTVTVTLSVTVPGTGDPAPTGQGLTVTATAGALHHSVITPLTVADEYVIHLLLGAAATGVHWGAQATNGVVVYTNTTVRIQNDDTLPHIIHTNTVDAGFPHQSIAGAGTLPGDSYSGTFSTPGSDKVTCHSHGGDTITVTFDAPPPPSSQPR